MPKGTKNHSAVGKRVEIPAYADFWMRGARFGVVERVKVGRGDYLDPKDVRGADLFFVRLDHPQARRKAFAFIANDCRFL